MKRLVLALSLLALPMTGHAGDADGPCIFSGITTTDFGSGSGFLAPSLAVYGFDSTTCSLVWKIDAPTCCNVLVTANFLAVGSSVDPIGVPLGPPFYSGSSFHLGGLGFILGPFTGYTGGVLLPSDPALIGLALPVQGIVEFFTTIGFTYDYGVTQGTLITFQ